MPTCLHHRVPAQPMVDSSAIPSMMRNFTVGVGRPCEALVTGCTLHCSHKKLDSSKREGQGGVPLPCGITVRAASASGTARLLGKEEDVCSSVMAHTRPWLGKTQLPAAPRACCAFRLEPPPSRSQAERLLHTPAHSGGIPGPLGPHPVLLDDIPLPQGNKVPPGAKAHLGLGPGLLDRWREERRARGSSSLQPSEAASICLSPETEMWTCCSWVEADQAVVL